MKYHYVQIITISLITLVLFRDAEADFFTSIAGLTKLLRTEGEVVRSLEKYIRFEEERLEKIKWLSKQYAMFHEAVNSDVDTFLMNPVNAYLLVKRLTADWETANSLIGDQSSRSVISGITSKRLSFPTFEDLSGAAEALRRLQETYLLDTSTIALGKINGSTLSAKLTAGDCFELGRQAYQAKELKHCLQWMNEALSRLDDEIENTANRTEIVEYMAFTAFVQKNYTYSMELNEYLLELNPHHTIAYENWMHCKQLKAKEEAKVPKGRLFGENDTGMNVDLKIDGTSFSNVIKTYEKLCRGETVKTPKEKSKLYCFHTTNNNSYLILQPVKAEILNLKPLIVVYYDILSDVEAEVIKILAVPRLQRDRVSNSTSGMDEFATYRISKGAGVHNLDHPLIPRLNRRVEAITGLNLDTAEMLDVINYGIGGHYEPHFDYAEPGDNVSFFKSAGNRIATWIFYLSHVPAGGSTVFPKIGVEVKPIKGSALFWYNLKRNGTGDPDTRHAACPVLVGSKWVGNKWIHEYGNEFRRTCSLDPLE